MPHPEDQNNLIFSTYFMASDFESHLASDPSIDEVISVCRGYGISRIYLETFREGLEPDRKRVAHARDRLQAAGFETAAAICTDGYGEPGTVLTQFPCLSQEASRSALADIVIFAASLFEKILIDEYIYSHCQCDACHAEKGERTWTDFRCEQIREVLRDCVIKPARKARPDIRLQYKFPGMYEQLARQGQDIDYIQEPLDGVWIGAEVGPFRESPQNMLRTQGAYRAFFTTRWMHEITGGDAGESRLGGSWIMPLEDTGLLLDSTYQSLLGSPRELLLHPYGGMSPSYDWGLRGGEGQFPAILRDSAELQKLVKITNENPVRGLVAARPNRAEPWDSGKAYDANVFDYIGQIGIPLRPTHDFPEDAEGFFLSLHTRSLPRYEEKIEALRHASVPILLTDGLAATLDKDFLDRANVFVIRSSVPAPCVIDYRGCLNAYDMEERASTVPAEKAWDALDTDVGWDISMRYSGDAQMAAKVFGMPHSVSDLLKRTLAETGQTVKRDFLPLEELRAEVLKPFGFSFRGPILVSVHPFGEDHVVLHNLNANPVTVWLEPENHSGIEPILTLPSTASTRSRSTDSGFRIDMDPHTLTCFRLGSGRA